MTKMEKKSGKRGLWNEKRKRPATQPEQEVKERYTEIEKSKTSEAKGRLNNLRRAS